MYSRVDHSSSICRCFNQLNKTVIKWYSITAVSKNLLYACRRRNVFTSFMSTADACIYKRRRRLVTWNGVNCSVIHSWNSVSGPIGSSSRLHLYNNTKKFATQYTWTSYKPECKLMYFPILNKLPNTFDPTMVVQLPPQPEDYTHTHTGS